MPYIRQDYRKWYDDEVEHLLIMLHQNKQPGELNYVITRLCIGFLSGKHYTDFNEVIGVLECAKLEFYRRLVTVMEDASKNLNGEVYDI
ncbi:MAG TPA: hypothetical protein ENI23_04110 [bacterium]|nr:hypothetical protein [bacterium]